ncbi:hypothetical protein [Ruminococcus sp. 5_1_39BFAA]|uniref:hypothetical protein n=1 Tax=Ruminococcus sp. 5_1_39BFAA TaxID=457412 RepID=UPI0035612CA2
MCTALERLKEEGRQEGREEGREENIRDLVREWTKDGYSVKEIAKLLKQSEDFVRKIQKEASVVI